MNILISVKTKYDLKNKTFINIIDENIFHFLNECIPRVKISILNHNTIKQNYDAYISFGGNNIPKFSNKKEDLKRFKLEKVAIDKFILNKKVIVGVCYGAQVISYLFDSKIKKIRDHVNVNHKIKFYKKTVIVNSYHDYGICSLGHNLDPISVSEDGIYEAFKHKKKKIFGIMWHPERNKKFKKFDIDIFREILGVN